MQLTWILLLFPIVAQLQRNAQIRHLFCPVGPWRDRVRAWSAPGPAGVHQKSGRTGDVLLLDSLMLRVLVVASALSAAAAFSPIATLPRTAARNYHFNLEVLLLYFEQTC